LYPCSFSQLQAVQLDLVPILALYAFYDILLAIPAIAIAIVAVAHLAPPFQILVQADLNTIADTVAVVCCILVSGELTVATICAAALAVNRLQDLLHSAAGQQDQAEDDEQNQDG